MVHSITKISDLNTAVNDYFTTFKDDIIASTNNQWHDEDNKGASFAGWKTMKYYTLLTLLILVYEEVQRTKDLNYSWSYFVQKYQLDIFKECLACAGIDIDKGLDAFKFDLLVPTEGIGRQEISVSLRVGTSSVVSISDTTIEELIATPNYCTLYIK